MAPALALRPSLRPPLRRASPLRVAVILALVSCAPPGPGAEGTRAPDDPPAATEPRPVDPTLGSPDAGDERAGVVATPTPEPEPEPWPEDYLRFDAGCDAGDRLVLGAVGDVLLHRELQRHAAEDPARFRAIWAEVAGLLRAPDLTYANLEGPLAPGLDREGNELPDPGLSYDGVVYSGYPRFNYHPSVAVDLRRDGVDVVSTANNHALDRGPLGVDRTIESLRRAGMAFTGTRASDALDAPWYTTTRAAGFRVAWVACTRHTNQRPDALGQVLRCDRDHRQIVRLVRRLASSDDVDAVIVTPHVGRQYDPEPAEREVQWAHDWLDAGAVAVIGSHPHVVRRWERHLTPDGRETLVLYSLGNFVSHQPELERRSSIVLYLGLVRGEDGQVRVAGARYVPIHVVREGDRFYARPAAPDDAGAAETRAHLEATFGAANRLEASQALAEGGIEVAPHCQGEAGAGRR